MRAVPEILKRFQEKLTKRRLANIARASSDIAFQSRCMRYLKSDGWKILLVNPGENSIVEQNGLKLLVLFCSQNALEWKITRKDWSFLRHQYGIPFVLVHRHPITTNFSQTAIEEKIGLCSYDNLSHLAEKVVSSKSLGQSLEQIESKPISLNTALQFSGTVDAFDHPSTIRGWVRLRDHGVLVSGLTIKAKLNGFEVGVGRPDRPRPDVCGDTHHLAGFTVDCKGLLLAKHMLTGEAEVFALDAAGNSYKLIIWDRLLEKLSNFEN